MGKGLSFRKAVSAVLIILGAALLLYAGSQYWTMYAKQRDLAREWKQQQIVPDHRIGLPETGLTRLAIPKIHLDAVVVEGTSDHALLLGPGHMKGTPAPGASGNSVISGHRDTFFRHIHELKPGDALHVSRNGRTFEYKVTGKKIVEPTDVSVLDQTADSRLTLITCYPTYYIGPAPERLIVFAEKVPSSNSASLEHPENAPKKLGATAAR